MNTKFNVVSIGYLMDEGQWMVEQPKLKREFAKEARCAITSVKTAKRKAKDKYQFCFYTLRNPFKHVFINE